MLSGDIFTSAPYLHWAHSFLITLNTNIEQTCGIMKSLSMSKFVQKNTEKNTKKNMNINHKNLHKNDCNLWATERSNSTSPSSRTSNILVLVTFIWPNCRLTPQAVPVVSSLYHNSNRNLPFRASLQKKKWIKNSSSQIKSSWRYQKHTERF